MYVYNWVDYLDKKHSGDFGTQLRWFGGLQCDLVVDDLQTRRYIKA